jgi:hypothetical protein
MLVVKQISSADFLMRFDVNGFNFENQHDISAQIGKNMKINVQYIHFGSVMVKKQFCRTGEM